MLEFLFFFHFQIFLSPNITISSYGWSPFRLYHKFAKKKAKKKTPCYQASASSVSLRNFDCSVVWKKVTIIERRELWCRICSCLLPSLISALSLSLSRSSLNTFGHPLLSCALLLRLLLSGIDIQASQLCLLWGEKEQRRFQGCVLVI